MASQGPFYPLTGNTASAAPESANDWLTPANITADDGSEAQITASTYDSPDISFRLKAVYSTQFTIPTGATIDGIVVEIDRRCFAGSARDYRVQLAQGSTLVGDNKASATAWPTTSGIATYGSSTDTWNSGLTVGNINGTAGSLSVFLSVEATAANTDIGVDFIRVTVYYTEGTPTNIDGDGALSFAFSTASVGQEVFSGSGGAAFGFAAAGVAEEVFSGTGGVAFPFSMSGAGDETLSGSGDTAFGFAVAGSGTAEGGDPGVTGDGALAFGFGAAGVAVEVFSGSGGVAFGFGAAGQGAELLTGAGGVTFGFNAAGVGAETLSGAGGVGFDFSVSADGGLVQPVSGSGSVGFLMVVDGEGSCWVPYPGDALLLKPQNKARWPWNRSGLVRR